jgi:adenylate cyclase
MSDSSQTRNLVAILAADVAGYSRLMGDDERATVHTLTEYRQVFTEHINRHRGHLVDTAGDSVLATFDSPVEGVECAVEIQRELARHNRNLADHRKMPFRIGINLGDVIVREDGTVYGDGVNIAARLQSLSKPGGICVSGSVYDQIEGKLPLTFQFMGEQAVKNIARPVRTYELEREAGIQPTAQSRNVGSFNPARKPILIAVAIIVIVASGASAWWWQRLAPPPAAKLTDTAGLSLPLPDKPSIAVLPFVNMSGDKEQEYFSDGMTEDVITSLSKLSGLFVIARNSVFTYKGQAVKPEQVSKELGVRYVLEGSVRKVQNQVRITAQLIDATTGYHLWAENYDGELKNIFALQDSVTQKIVSALAPKLSAGEQIVRAHPETTSAEAYDLVLRGINGSMQLQKEANASSRQMFEKAIELDQNYAKAYAELSWSYFNAWVYQWTQDAGALITAINFAKKAVSLDGSLADAHRVLGWTLLWNKQQDLGIEELEKALSLAPNSSTAYGQIGGGLNYAGKPEEAIGFIRKAMRLDPKYGPWVAIWLAESYFLLHRYDEAIALYQDALRRNPAYAIVHRQLATTYAEMGREQDARAEAAALLRMSPAYNVDLWLARLPFKDKIVLDRYTTALKKAGLK